MRCPILSVASLLIGITFAATDVASGQVTGGNMACHAPGFIVDWSGTLPDHGSETIVSCFAPNYQYQSPEVHYCPDNGTSTDGSETTDHVAQSQTYEGIVYQLAGGYVWYEWGYWSGSIWISEGYTTWYYIPRPSAGTPPLPITCFAAGTPLLTQEGSKPIEQFKIGDWILSSPEDDPEAPVVARRVKDVIRSRGQLVDITVSGQVIHASREHPFYVKRKGWTPVASLAVGDLLRSHDNRWLPVESIVQAAESPVYNVCVEENGTYFVGDRDRGFSLWVYGACNRPKTPLEQLAQSKPVRSLFPSGKPLSRRREADQLLWQDRGAIPGAIEPESQTSFFTKIDAARSTFSKNVHGNATGVTLDVPGLLALRGKKVAKD